MTHYNGSPRGGGGVVVVVVIITIIAAAVDLLRTRKALNAQSLC